MLSQKWTKFGMKANGIKPDAQALVYDNVC